MLHLRLQVFGTFQVTLDGQALEGFRSDKVRALLAYLLVERKQAHQRAHLTDLLWHGYPTQAARTSLRTALSNLRHVLAPLDLLITAHQSVAVSPTCQVWCSAHELEAVLLDRGRTAEPLCQVIESLCAGPFLADLAAIDSAPFQAWCRDRTAHYRALIDSTCRRPARRSPRLPAPLTSFVGRRAETADLCARLQAPLPRLVTLVGAGGVGKTRLALAVAQRLEPMFADGVGFVALGGLPPGEDPPEQLAAALAAALDLRLSHTAAGFPQVVRALQGSHMLLVLDSMDHLGALAAALAELLQAAPDLRVLATSRQRLHVQGEEVVAVQGLPAPAPDDRWEPSERLGERPGWEAVQLFVERVVSLAPQPLSAELVQSGAQIARRVSGLPLAIELAASLATHLPPARLIQIVQHYALALCAPWADQPAPQRSLFAVIASTWQLLSPDEQLIVRRLCALAEDDLDDATLQALTGATPAQIDDLAERSLLLRLGPGRYGLHSLIRQYVAQHAPADPSAAAVQAEMLTRYRTRQLSCLAAQSQQLRSYPTSELVQTFQHDLENLRRAWCLSVEERDWALLGRSAGALADLYQLLGRSGEGSALLQRALQALPGHSRSAEVRTCLLVEQAQLLCVQSRFDDLAAVAQQLTGPTAGSPAAGWGYLWQGVGLLRQAHLDAAREELERAQALFTRACDQRGEAMALDALGTHAASLGQIDRASASYRAALGHSQACGDLRLSAWIWSNLGACNAMAERGEQAHAIQRAALAHFQRLGDLPGESLAQLRLGAVLLSQGDLPGAAQALERALLLSHRCGQIEQQSAAHAYLELLAECRGQSVSALDDALETFQDNLSPGARCLLGVAASPIGYAYALGQHVEAAYDPYAPAVNGL